MNPTVATPALGPNANTQTKSAANPAAAPVTQRQNHPRPKTPPPTPADPAAPPALALVSSPAVSSPLGVAGSPAQGEPPCLGGNPKALPGGRCYPPTLSTTPALTHCSHNLLQRALDARDRFFNLSRDLLCVVGFDGYFVRFNPSWLRLLGWTATELTAVPFWEFVHPEDRPATRRRMERLGEGPESEFFVSRYRCKDGSYRWIEWQRVLDFDSEELYGCGRDITERKAAEAALDQLNCELATQVARLEQEMQSRQWAEAQLHQSAQDIFDLYNRAPCGYHSLDSAGQFVKINDTELLWLGCERSHLVGQKKFSDLLSPEDALAFERVLPRLRARGWVSNLEVHLTRVDGSALPVLLSAAAVYDEAGAYVGCRMTLFDITALEAARQGLERSRSRFEQASAAGRVGLWEWEVKNNCYRSWNLRSLLGYGNDDLEETYDGWMGLLHPDDRAECEEKLCDSLAPGGRSTFEVETRLRAHSGVYRWFLSRGQVLRDETGEGYVVCGTSVDIDDRKRIDLALRESERRYAALAHAVPVGIFQGNPSRGCLYVNDRWCELSGLSPEQSMGFNWLAWVHEDDRPALDQSMAVFATTPEPKTCEFRLIHATSHRILWVVCQVVPEYNSEGTFLGYLGAIMDVTAAKEAELARQQLEARLQAVISHLPNSALGLLDPTGRYVLVDGPEVARWGWGNQAAVGKSPSQLFPPKVAKRLTQGWREAMAGRSSQFEVEFKTRTYRVDTIRLPESCGPDPLVLFSAIDITVQRQAQRDRQIIEARYRTAVRALPNSILALFDHQLQVVLIEGDELAKLKINLPPAGSRQRLGDLLADSLQGQELMRHLQAALAGRTICTEMTWGDRTYLVDFAPIPGDQPGETWALAAARNINDLKQVERDLRESEYRYADLARVAPVGIFRTNANGRCTYANERLARMSGLTLVEIYGKFWIEALHPDDQASFALEWAVCCRHYRSFQGEYRFLQPDGTIVWAFIQAAPRYDLQGQYLGYVGTLTDINDRVGAEMALRESEAQFRRLVENLPGLVFRLHRSPAGKVRVDFISAYLQNLCGLEPEEVMENPFRLAALVPTEDLQKLATALEESAQRLAPFSLDHRLYPPNSPEIWLRAIAVPERQVNGEVIWDGVAIDITAIEQAKASLRLSEERFHLIGRATNDALWDVDFTAGRRWWGEAFHTLFGHPAGEKPQTHDPWAEYLHPDDRPTVLAQTQAWIEGGEAALQREYRFRRADGSYAQVLDRGYAIRNACGRAVRILGAMTDISQRKEAEVAIASLNQTLRQRASELAATNRELEAFSYSVSHDLRAPLRSIQGFSALLGEECWELLNEDGRDYLQRIQASTERMQELIEDLLMLSRVSRSELESEVLDLAQLARAVASDLSREAHSTSPDAPAIAWQIPDRLPARGDRRLLRIVLENLLRNACKFSRRRDGATIAFGYTDDREAIATSFQTWASIALPKSTLDAPTAAYFVQDNGAGFDMRHAAKLFKAFQRLHQASEFEGTGIGLAIVARIVARHGGIIWAQGSPNQGATFYFSLVD